MTQTNTTTGPSGEFPDSLDWQAIPDRLSNLENEVKTLPCQACDNNLINFVTHDILVAKIKPLASKKDLEEEIGRVTDTMVKQKDIDKLATLEDLEKLSEKVAELAEEIGKCAKQEGLDKLTAEVNRLAKEVEKCAKQEDLDKLAEKVDKLAEKVDKLSEKVDNLSDEVDNLSTKFTSLSEKSTEFATKEDLKNLKSDIDSRFSQLDSRLSQTNFGILVGVAFLSLVITLGGTDKIINKVAEVIMSILSMLT